uniref:Phospholipid phosphatase 2 n=1 Tax=Mus musculus TaxID=10090 RepID=E9PV78_MOUSE
MERRWVFVLLDVLCVLVGLIGRSLPGVHRPSLFAIQLQQLCSCHLQGAGNLSVRGCCEPVSHRPGQVHDWPSSTQFLGCL